MASTYKIGQQPQPQPIQQYPPFYDPQKQKEKEDLENAPMQLMNMFANAKGFEGASWQADEYTNLNNELNAKMKHILFSDYSPAAKQYAAAALLIDNLTGDMYNKRMSLNEYKVQEDEYDKLLTQYTAKKEIDTGTAEIMRKINNGKNKNIYENAKKNNLAIPHPETYLVPIINNSDNFYNPKFFQLKEGGTVTVSSGTGGTTQTELAGSSTSKNAGHGNISFPYLSEEKYENDAATIFMQDVESPHGYLTKARIYNDYISLINEEFKNNPEDLERERKNAEAILFSNAPKIYSDEEKTELVTDLDIISDITMGLNLTHVKDGERNINGTTYYFNFEEFTKNNKELVFNKEEIEAIENSYKTYNSTTGKTEYKRREQLILNLIVGEKAQIYTNQALTAQSNEDMASLSKKGNALFNLNINNNELITPIVKLNRDNNVTNLNLVNLFLTGLTNDLTLPRIAAKNNMSIESTEILLLSADALKKYIEDNPTQSYNEVLSYYYSQAILNVSVKTKTSTPSSTILSSGSFDNRSQSFYLPLDLNNKNNQQRTTIELSSEIKKIFEGLKNK